MHNPLTVLGIVCFYIGVLFAIALWVERGPAKIKRFASNPVIYSLALAVYCTSWTYYGSVGSAANAGMLFLTIYLGPTLAIVLWWFVVRKLVRIKTTQRITSIADFVSARYGKSQSLAAIATLLALIGTTPYIALQLKAVTSTFTLITSPNGVQSSWIGANVGPMVVILMIIFTIIFGVRRLDPTERHEGIVAALAAESFVKLVAFLAVGIFVTYFVYDGFDDIFRRLSVSPFQNMMNVAGADISSYITWTTYLILAMSAIMFLPRQFHVAVIENSDENHLKTAIWLFPLYLFLINIFVVPIAAGGLLQGLPANRADTFVLALPLLFNQSALALLVFIGGFSAATGMVIVSSMTTSTMVTNHLLLPLLHSVPGLSFLQRHILKARWVAVALILILGYGFERLTGESYTLVNMGIISFAAVLQFAPVILGGLFWSKGNKPGAILGLSAGFLVWFYTLLLPSFVRSGWFLSPLFIETGPWGIAVLKPEQLFGVTELSTLSHTVLWSMIFNIGFYLLGSLYFEKDKEEEGSTQLFVGALDDDAPSRSFAVGKSTVYLADKLNQIEEILSRYFTPIETAHIIDRCLNITQIKDKEHVSVTELAEFYTEIEKSLAGSIGAATAHRVLSQMELFTREESLEFSETYSEILAELRVSPADLRKRIDYYQERDTLLTNQASELEQQVAERTRALEVSAQISRQIATILDVDQLLNKVVNLIRTNLNYDHVHIYLTDSKTDQIVFREGTGDVGRQLKASGYKLKSGQGTLGHVVESKQPLLVHDTTTYPDFAYNPLLSRTRSELAVPLQKGQEILGVLDMQSERVNDFQQSDVTLIQSVADQVAIVLENARLFRQTQEALAEIEATHRQYLAQSWSTFRQTQAVLQAEEKRGTRQTDDNKTVDTLKQLAFKQSKLIAVDEETDGEIDNVQPAGAALIAPLKLRGQIIGTLGLQEDTKHRWTEDEIALVEAVTEQISQALERARLFDDTQRRATREQLTRKITDKMRAAPDVETIIQTGLTELANALKVSRTYVKLTDKSDEQETKSAPDIDQIRTHLKSVGRETLLNEDSEPTTLSVRQELPQNGADQQEEN